MYGLIMAWAAAQRADCTRRHAGAVIFDTNHRLVSSGYNGAASGMAGCLTDGACPRGRLNVVSPGSSYETPEGKCSAVHAEANALIHVENLSVRTHVLRDRRDGIGNL